MRCLTVIASLALAMITASACDEPLRNLAGPSPDLTPTFDSIRVEIFQTTDLAGRTSCVTCHTSAGRNPAGGLNLATDPYAALVNVTSTGRRDMIRVVPGNPDASYLIHKLEGRSGIAGLRMPFTPPYLTAGQIQVVKRWIEIGAPR
jgi:hypothetical protein